MPWIAFLLSLASVPASAQEAAPVEAASTGPQLGANLRYRYMFVPKGIINTWYNDTDDWSGEQAGLDRPNVNAHVIGLEFAIEPEPASFLVYAEYWAVNIGEGYWDDKDDGASDFTDGDWLRPSKLGMVAAGVDFGHEFQLTDFERDVALGLRMGGGLGIGIPTGTIEQWHPGALFSTEPTNNCEPELYAYDRQAVCPADEELKVPPVLPILDMDLAFRLHFAQTGILRLEAGLHDLIYFGVAGGAVF